MQYSTNYNMNKPELAEQYRLSHWNDNTDIIDSNMKRIDDLTSNIENVIDPTFKTALLNFCYPVGSLYWSSKSTNPASLFGGTWVQIKDRFVLACGDTYKSVGATGGASSVTLSVSNMPSHNHSFTPSGTVSSSFTGTTTSTGGMSNNATGDFESVIRSVITVASNNTNPAAWKASANDGNASYVSGCFSIGSDKFSQYGINNDPPWRPDHAGTMGSSARGCLHIDVSHTHNITAKGTVSSSFSGSAGTTESRGDGTSFSILPPYVVKYCWERTA